MIIRMTHDGGIIYFHKHEMSFEELIQQYYVDPPVISVTREAFLALDSKEQFRIKRSAALFHFGDLLEIPQGPKDRDKHRKTKKNIKSFNAMKFDIDHPNDPEKLIEDARTKWDFNFILHTTIRSTKEEPRIRIIIPFETPLEDKDNDTDRLEDTFSAIARQFACLNFPTQIVDKVSYTSNQAMAAPVVLEDQEYFLLEKHDQRNIDFQEMLDWYTDNKLDPLDKKNWYRNTEEDKRKQQAKEEKAKNNPSGSKKSSGSSQKKTSKKVSEKRKGIIAKFNKAFPTHQEAIQTYLSDVYEPTSDPSRYKLIEASSTAGLSISADGKWAHTYHSSDPAGAVQTEREENGEKSGLDRFDLVCIHLFKNDAEEMEQFLLTDPEFQKRNSSLQGRELILNAPKDLLRMSFNGICLRGVTASYNYVMDNDENLSGIIAYDEIFRTHVLTRDCFIRSISPEGPELKEVDLLRLRSYIERTYDLRDKTAFDDALSIYADEHRTNTIERWIKETQPDGKDRMHGENNIFCIVFGADPSPLLDAQTRVFFLGAMMRLVEKESKMDYSLNLIGPHGIGKDWFFDIFSFGYCLDHLDEYNNREVIDKILALWFLIDSEGIGEKQTTLQKRKNFKTRKKEIHRRWFGKLAEKFDRHFVLVVTRNNPYFLEENVEFDRRELIINCKGTDFGKNIENPYYRNEIAQFRRQAYDLYMSIRNDPEKLKSQILLSDEEKAWLAGLQKNHHKNGEDRALLEFFLEAPLPVGYKDLEPAKRWKILGDPNQKTEGKRNKVCLKEIMEVVFDLDPSKKGPSWKETKAFVEEYLQFHGWTPTRPSRNGDPYYGTQRYWVRNSNPSTDPGDEDDPEPTPEQLRDLEMRVIANHKKAIEIKAKEERKPHLQIICLALSMVVESLDKDYELPTVSSITYRYNRMFQKSLPRETIRGFLSDLKGGGMAQENQLEGHNADEALWYMDEQAVRIIKNQLQNPDQNTVNQLLLSNL